MPKMGSPDPLAGFRGRKKWGRTREGKKERRGGMGLRSAPKTNSWPRLCNPGRLMQVANSKTAD